MRKNYNILMYHEFSESDFEIIGIYFSKIAKSYGMNVQTCFEYKTLEEYGFTKGECMPKELAYKLTG